MPALLDLAGTRFLETAWHEVTQTKKRLPSFYRVGLDGQSMQTFESRRDQGLAELGRRIRQKQFRFSLLEPVFVPKQNGKERLICVPIIADRIVQRALLNFVSRGATWMDNGISYGFVRARTVPQAVDQAKKLRQQKPWAIKTDITAFFDCIDRGLLWEMLTRRVKHRSLHPLLEQAMNCEIAVGNNSLKDKLRKVGVRPGRGVRQGMALSPYFANVMLEPFDKACIKRGCAAVRYADDLLFFADSRAEAERVLEFCTTELRKLNLGIPELADESKTQIAAPAEPVAFLGTELACTQGEGYELRVASAQFDKMKEALYDLKSVADLRKRNLDVARFGNSLEARVRAFEAAYEHCVNLPDVLEHLKACRNNVVEALMDSLGVQIKTLNDDARWFLGLQPRPQNA